MSMLNSYDANFFFLGHRNYVHGSSMTHGLFDAVENWSLGSIERLQLNVHHQLKEQGRYELFKSEAEQAQLIKEYHAAFRLQCKSGAYFVELKGRGEPVKVSKPYPEDKLLVDCEILENRKTATLKLHPNKKIINTIIALNKKLVNTLFQSKDYGQWFLARYDLIWNKMWVATPTLLKIEVIGNIGERNTNSAIKLDGELIGSIYFARNIQ